MPFWKGVVRKIGPDAKTTRGKQLSQLSLGERLSRTLDLIKLWNLKERFKRRKIQLDVDSMVEIANALKNSGSQQKKSVANYFVQKHFSNYFAKEFPGQQAILGRTIAPRAKIEAATVANAFPDAETAIKSLQVIMKEMKRIIEDIKAAKPYSPPTREYRAGLVADLFNNALTFPLTRIDGIINELRKPKNDR